MKKKTKRTWEAYILLDKRNNITGFDTAQVLLAYRISKGERIAKVQIIEVDDKNNPI